MEAALGASGPVHTNFPGLVPTPGRAVLVRRVMQLMSITTKLTMKNRVAGFPENIV